MINDIITIAVHAGKAIMEIYNSDDFGIESKSDESPLTKADLAANEIIVESIKKLNLGYPIMTEENVQVDYQERKNWERYWLIDPLDGTKEFIKRNGEFTVNIALIENETPILGVVYVPVTGVCYHGSDKGSFVIRDNVVDQIKCSTHLYHAPIKVIASRSHKDERLEILLDNLGPIEISNMGSSLKICAVAEGIADLYPRTGPTMEWDTAAAHAVVKYAGGSITDIDGDELIYNKMDLHNPEFFVLDELNDQVVIKLYRAIQRLQGVHNG